MLPMLQGPFSRPMGLKQHSSCTDSPRGLSLDVHPLTLNKPAAATTGAPPSCPESSSKGSPFAVSSVSLPCALAMKRPKEGLEASCCSPPPPLIVRSLHTSVTAEELRASFSSFGALHCVMVDQRPLKARDSSKRPQGEPPWRGAPRKALGRGLLWYKQLAAFKTALHAAPKIFRGLPCSLQPSPSFWSRGPLLLLQGGPLRAGHAWRRCERCGSVAFEAAAAATTAGSEATAATGVAADPAAVLLGWRLGEEQQLRVSWAEGRHAVLLEFPLRALVGRVYLLAAATAAAAAAAADDDDHDDLEEEGNRDRCSSSQQRQLLLLLCPEHAPRVTIVDMGGKSPEGGPNRAPFEGTAPASLGQAAAVLRIEEEAANAAAALLLGGDSEMQLPLHLQRWASGAESATGLVSPLLQHLEGCRDLLVSLSPSVSSLRGDLKTTEETSWITELRRHLLLASQTANNQIPQVYLSEAPRDRQRHMHCISQAVLHRAPTYLRGLPFASAVSLSAAPGAQEPCSNCPAAAAAAASAAGAVAVDGDGLLTAGAAATAAAAGGTAARPHEALQQGREGDLIDASTEETDEKRPVSLPSPASGWLLWVELQQLLASGMLPPPSLFEIPQWGAPQKGYEGAPGGPVPLPLLLADPRNDPEMMRGALRAFAQEVLVEREVIAGVSPAARMHAVLQHKQ